MSRSMIFVEITPQQLDILMDDPADSEFWVEDEDYIDFDTAVAHFAPDAWSPLLFLITHDEFLTAEEDEADTCVNYIFEGEPMEDLPVGDFANALGEEDVAYAAEALQAFSPEALTARFRSPHYQELADTDEVYRYRSYRTEAQLPEVLAAYEGLRQFFAQAAARRHAVVYYWV